MTAEEYLRWEETQLEKHEFVNGQVREMGAIEIWSDMTAEHDLVVRRLAARLAEHLRATPCTVALKGPDTPMAPDLVVHCDMGIRLVIEVLTPQSTPSKYGTGFSRHRSQPAVREIVQITLAHRRGDVYQRHGSHGSEWLLHSFEAGGTVMLASIDLRVSVDDLFEGLGPAPVPLYRPSDSMT